MAAISHIGHTSAVNMPVTKKRQPKPLGRLCLYMGKPPVSIYYVKDCILLRILTNKKIDDKIKVYVFLDTKSFIITTEGKIIKSLGGITMKKMYGFMIIAGFVLATVTAGGADANSISIMRLASQATVASLLMLSGTFLILRGEKA